MDTPHDKPAPVAKPRGSRKLRGAARGAIHSVVIGFVALTIHIGTFVSAVRFALADQIDDPRVEVLSVLAFVALGLNFIGAVHAIYSMRETPTQNALATFGLVLNALGILGMGTLFFVG